MQSAWNIANNKNPFLTQILKAKYYNNTSFWKANNRGTRSIFWSSILQVKEELSANCMIQIHGGNTPIWSEPWTPLWSDIHDHLNILVTTNPLPAKVSDLWIQGTHDWDHQLIANTFSTDFTNSVTSTQIIPSDTDDILRWQPATNGQCTSKNIYLYLASQNTEPLPPNGTRSIHPNANQILQKA